LPVAGGSGSWSDWQPETHLNSLTLIKAGGVSLAGLDDGLELLRGATADLKKSAEARS